MNRLTILALTASVALAGVGAQTLPAQADQQFQIAFTGIGIYPRTAPSMDSSTVGAALPDGASVTVVCELRGQSVFNGDQSIDVWARTVDGTHLPNAFLLTGYDGWTPGIPKCDDPSASAEPATPTQEYYREEAARNALAFADTLNFFGPADCTYFVSLSMWDGGGLPQTDDWTTASSDESKWGARRLAPGVTKAAINADEFTRYMERSGTALVSEITWSDQTADGAQLGDVIAYDWVDSQGNSGADGIIDHLAMVTGWSTDGHPLVSQHSPSQINRYWSWSENANEWIEFAQPGSKAYLLHIVA